MRAPVRDNRASCACRSSWFCSLPRRRRRASRRSSRSTSGTTSPSRARRARAAGPSSNSTASSPRSSATRCRRAACARCSIGADGDMAVLSRRTAAARDAALFLSVHHDSVQPHYLEEWVLRGRDAPLQRPLRRLLAVRLAPQSGARAEPRLRRPPIGAAMRGAGFAPSLYHAEPIPGESKPFADRTNGVHYYDNLVVLHSATPAGGPLRGRGDRQSRRGARAARPRPRSGRIAAAVADGVEPASSRAGALTLREALG